MSKKRLVILNVVGLTPELLVHAPNLSTLGRKGAITSMTGVTPAVTLPAQATMLTGVLPTRHGVIGNGWYRRDIGEARAWVQANDQICTERFDWKARRLAKAGGRDFKVAHLFWWFAQGSHAELMLTPKPHYGADGSKAFDIMSYPPAFADEQEADIGKFPFFNFWGPKAGLPVSDWIARASARTLERERPDLTFVYLPHLDYDLQRLGVSGADLPRLVGEVDAAASLVVDAADSIDAEVMVVSEYGLTDVSRAAHPNHVLREAGMLSVRHGPFGEMVDVMSSRAFAYCDHQVAQVYVPEATDRDKVAALLEGLPEVAEVLGDEGKTRHGIAHSNAGELVLLAKPDAWFAYPYWLDEAKAPDFARTVDIHRKPGYDPCELFLDPQLSAPKLRVIRKVLAKKLGFRALVDATPLDAGLIKGSHGLAPATPEKGPLLLSGNAELAPTGAAMTDIAGLALKALGLGGGASE